ncbi:MAG: hypothetical protein JZD40_01130 [Sulfolobus sp.]|nr:hypothetical protein [Sulfolobus sp.]
MNKKAKQYEGKMRIYFHPRDIAEELQIKFKQPTGNPIITANGKVKLINSVPYVVADVRKHSFEEMWERYKKGWKHPKVAEYVKEVAMNPKAVSKAILQIELDL